MSANLSEHARVARLIGLPQVARPQPPTPEPAPSSPAGSLFDGSDDEDVPNLDLDNSKAEQISSTKQASGAQPLRAPIPDLKDVFPKPDAALPLGPPSTSSPATKRPRVSLKGSRRPPAGVRMLNPHACEGRSVWTSSGGAPNIPEAVQARTTGTSVARAPAPSRHVLPASLQRPRPPPRITPPPPTRTEARRQTRTVQDTRNVRDAPAPENATTTQEQGAGDTGSRGDPWPTNRFEYEWEGPPPTMVTATRRPQVAAHTRGSGPQRATGRTAPTTNPAPTPNAGAPPNASRLARTRTAPPATRPSPARVPAPVPTPPTGQAARPVRPLPPVRKAGSISTRPPPAPAIPRRRAPGPSTTTMQEAPRRIPLPQLTGDARIFTPHQLSAIALARAASDPNLAMYIPPATHVSPRLLTQPYVAPLPLPTISGTTAQPGNSRMAYAVSNQMEYDEGTQDVPVEEMRVPSAGPSGGTHPSTSHYARSPQPVESSVTPTGSQDGSTPIQPPALSHSHRLTATGAIVSYFGGAYIPPPSMPGSVLGQKRPADAMEILDDEAQGIQPPSQSAKRSKYTHE